MIKIRIEKTIKIFLVLSLLLIFCAALTLAVGEFIIDSSTGNIGIGTTDTGVINTGDAYKWGLNTTDKVFVISSLTGAVLNLENRFPTVNTVNIGKKLGAVVFSNTAGQGDAHRQLTGIVSRITGISGSTTYLADLGFFTKGGSVAGESMTITSGGNIVIGTTTISPTSTITADTGDLTLKSTTGDVIIIIG